MVSEQQKLQKELNAITIELHELDYQDAMEQDLLTSKTKEEQAVRQEVSEERPEKNQETVEQEETSEALAAASSLEAEEDDVDLAAIAGDLPRLQQVLLRQWQTD